MCFDSETKWLPSVALIAGPGLVLVFRIFLKWLSPTDQGTILVTEPRNGAQQGGDQAGDDGLDGGGQAGHEGSSRAERSQS